MPKRHVHRRLAVNTPYLKGADIEALQDALNKAFKHFRIDRKILADGELGPATLSAIRQVAYMKGVSGQNRKSLRKGRVTKSVQRLVRGRKKSPREIAATVARAPFRKNLRKKFDKTGGEKALAWAKKQIGTTESPAGSNWGPEIGEWIRFTGYSGPVFWCGCFVCYGVVKIGGAKIPSRIRLGFDGYIKADAFGSDNGLIAVGFSEARAGDIVTFTFPHIEMVDHVASSDVMKTVGGNTSPENSGGSEANGGGVFPRTRYRSQVAVVARPAY